MWINDDGGAMASGMIGRAALVTGGSSGIGLALATTLAERGYAITLVGRQQDKLDRAVRRVEEAGGTAHAVAGNLADEQTAVRAIREHRERFGRLDVLVNSAGLGMAEPIHRLTTKRLDLQLDVNVRAVAVLCREAADLLREAGREHGNALVLNLASISGKQGVAGFAAYSATKFAVVGLSEALAGELAPDGVKVTALCPALVDTPMTDPMEATVPKASMIRVEDVATAFRMLLDLSPACVVPELVLGRPGAGLTLGGGRA
jgi:short-subunit dehydrogenase